MPDNRITSKELITAISGALAEWLFAMLPIVVVMFVMAYLEKLSAMPNSPEWAFGASVLAGQTISRFVSGIMQAGRLSLDRVSLGISVLCVMIIVPANIVLAIVIIHAETNEHHLTDFLAVLQILLFCISSVVYIIVAVFAHLWMKRSRSHHNQTQEK
jgi:hypothetical protein